MATPTINISSLGPKTNSTLTLTLTKQLAVMYIRSYTVRVDSAESSISQQQTRSQLPGTFFFLAEINFNWPVNLVFIYIQ